MLKHQSLNNYLIKQLHIFPIFFINQFGLVNESYHS